MAADEHVGLGHRQKALQTALRPVLVQLFVDSAGIAVNRQHPQLAQLQPDLFEERAQKTLVLGRRVGVAPGDRALAQRARLPDSRPFAVELQNARAEVELGELS
jgi:hypothetical protein